jgi:N-acetylglucosamine-6-phosphate deacetylase
MAPSLAVGPASVRTLIVGGQVLTPDETLDGYAVVIEDRRIAGLTDQRRLPAERTIDAAGLRVVPGLIDLHVHGAVGSDVMDATPQALRSMEDFFLRHGVTAYLPTTMTASPPALLAALTNVANAPASTGAQRLGVHLEGPYVAAGQRGAQPGAWLRPPDPLEYERWFASGAVRLITLAPELPGALELIESAARHGVHTSAGHTEASYEQVRTAVDRGLRHATHTFNAMSALRHREPGAVGAVLTDDRVYAEVIADGVHVHPAVVSLVVRAKGVERVTLVTDAMRATGLADGAYDLGGQTIDVRDGVARTASGALAGSTLTLNTAVHHAQRFGQLSPNQALAMATRVPAEALGLAGHKGVLRPGADADIVLVDDDWHVHAAIVGGVLAFNDRQVSH